MGGQSKARQQIESRDEKAEDEKLIYAKWKWVNEIKSSLEWALHSLELRVANGEVEESAKMFQWFVTEQAIDKLLSVEAAIESIVQN